MFVSAPDGITQTTAPIQEVASPIEKEETPPQNDVETTTTNSITTSIAPATDTIPLETLTQQMPKPPTESQVADEHTVHTPLLNQDTLLMDPRHPFTPDGQLKRRFYPFDGIVEPPISISQENARSSKSSVIEETGESSSSTLFTPDGELKRRIFPWKE